MINYIIFNKIISIGNHVFERNSKCRLYIEDSKSKKDTTICKTGLKSVCFCKQLILRFILEVLAFSSSLHFGVIPSPYIQIWRYEHKINLNLKLNTKDGSEYQTEFVSSGDRL